MSALVFCECPKCECPNMVAIPDANESDEDGPLCDDCFDGNHAAL